MFDTEHLIQMGKINLDEISCWYFWWYDADYFNLKFAKMVLNYKEFSPYAKFITANIITAVFQKFPDTVFPHIVSALE